MQGDDCGKFLNLQDCSGGARCKDNPTVLGIS